MVAPAAATTSFRAFKQGSGALHHVLKISQPQQHQQHQHQYMLLRHFSKKQLTPSITFLTNNEADPFMQRQDRGGGGRSAMSAGAPTPKSAPPPASEQKPSLAEFTNSERRPLSILLCWLMSKPRAIQKYAQFYLDQGFDVLTVRISPWELLWPSYFNTHTINNEVLPILNSSRHEKKLIHGFSVGGYVFSQLLKQFYVSPGEHGELVKSIQAQIWDSVVDVNGVAVGVSKSMCPDSPSSQRLLQSYIDWHMKIFYGVATKYYEEAHNYFYYKPLMAPSLFLASKIDPISTIDVINDVRKCWGSAGIDCTSRIWDNTQHVGHMHKYPEEYKQIVKTFLDKVDWKGSSNDSKRTETIQKVIPKSPAAARVVMPPMQQTPAEVPWFTLPQQL